jgi:hypothetical protein
VLLMRQRRRRATIALTVRAERFFMERRMNSKTLDRLRAEVMQLGESERAALAHDLVISLDKTSESDAASAWDDELRQRLSAIDDGAARLIDRDEFRRRLRAARTGG